VGGVGVRDNPDRGFHRHHARQRLLEQFSRRLRSSSPRKVLVPASPRESSLRSFSVQVRHSSLATTLISFFYSISMP